MTDRARYQLAGLASLESVVEIAMHAVVETYRAFAREPRSTDPPEITSARKLVDLCAYLLVAIDAHRRHVARHLPDDEHNWPF